MDVTASPPALRTDIYPAISPALFHDALQGKTAVITGSGRGIGRAIALALAQAGSSVVITSRTISEVTDTARHIRAVCPNVKVLEVVADVLKHQDLERLVNETLREFGGIDIAVLNAGANTFLPFHKTDARSWWDQVELNLRAPVELTRLVLPCMQSANAGTLIYVSSRAANANLPWTTAYNASKSALGRFAGSLQAELDVVQRVEAGHPANGISTFTIHPGEVNTRLHETAFPQRTHDEAPYVIEAMQKLSANRPTFTAELSAWTCVFLTAGKAEPLRGEFIDCTRDIAEVLERKKNDQAVKH